MAPMSLWVRTARDVPVPQLGSRSLRPHGVPLATRALPLNVGPSFLPCGFYLQLRCFFPFEFLGKKILSRNKNKIPDQSHVCSVAVAERGRKDGIEARAVRRAGRGCRLVHVPCLEGGGAAWERVRVLAPLLAGSVSHTSLL